MTIITSGITIIQMIPKNFKTKYKIFFDQTYLMIFSIFCTFIWLVFHYYIKKKLLFAGVNGEPIKFKYYIKRFNPVLLLHFAQEIHSFHHALCDAKLKIKNRNITTPNDKEAKEITASLLQKCQDILKLTLGEDFSLNIKLFENKTNIISDKLSNVRDSVLLTYERVPSKKEKEKYCVHEIRKRSNNEKFVISKWDSDNIENLFTLISSYKGKYKKNLAYDYVFSQNNHFWLSNDLEKDSQKRIFKSTSDDYLIYYKSLAVFLLSPPLTVGEHVDIDKVLGLIIFDSIETNVFHTEYSKQILGYFSHLFYDYFLTFDVFKTN